jgi:hypothetical protein
VRAVLEPGPRHLEIGGEAETVLVPLVKELIDIDRARGVVIVKEGLL